MSDLLNLFFELKAYTLNMHDPLVMFVIIGISGIVAGKFFHKFNLPDITGQVLIGILIGILFSKHQIHSLSYFSDIALGFMTFTIGTHLNYKVIHNSGSRILKLAIFDSLFTFIFVFAALFLLVDKLNSATSIILASIAIATAPGTIITLIQKKFSRGVFTKTLVGVVALNNFSTIVIFEMAKFFGIQLLLSSGSKAEISIIKPIIVILFTIVYGFVSAFIFKTLVKHQHRRGDLFATMLITITVNIAVCGYFGLSHLLVNLIVGIVFCNTSYHVHRIGKINENITEILFAIFFTLAGTHLDLSQLKIAGVAGVIFVLSRIFAKSLGAFIASKIYKYPKNIANYLGLGLIPQAGLAIGLVISLNEVDVLSGVIPIVSTIVLAAVAVNELIGPFTTSKSIDMSKETGQATPRIIDFLQEEFILMPLKAKDKWSAIEKLTDFMVKTNNLVSTTRDELLQYTIEREESMTTGIGRGIAIPHARVGKNEKFMGVIGISKKGIEFDSVDKKPVNVVFLIATPEGQEKLHVSLLSAIAKIFAEDPCLINDIINSSDPAEVYDFFQSKQVRDINSYIKGD